VCVCVCVCVCVYARVYILVFPTCDTLPNSVCVYVYAFVCV